MLKRTSAKKRPGGAIAGCTRYGPRCFRMPGLLVPDFLLLSVVCSNGKTSKVLRHFASVQLGSRRRHGERLRPWVDMHRFARIPRKSYAHTRQHVAHAFTMAVSSGTSTRGYCWSPCCWSVEFHKVRKAISGSKSSFLDFNYMIEYCGLMLTTSDPRSSVPFFLCSSVRGTVNSASSCSGAVLSFPFPILSSLLALS